MNDIQIVSFIQGNLSDDERKEVLSWVNASENNRIHFELIQTLWEKPDAIPEEKPDLDVVWQNFLDRRLTKKKPDRQLTSAWKRFAVAASFVLMSLLIWFIISYPQKLEYANNGEDPGTPIELPDGTKVWLNRYSRVTLSEDFNEGERELQLLGEAYFDVTTNPEKPFIIQANKIQLRVLGTSFNVMAYRDSLFNRVDVSSGRVAFQVIDSPGNKIELTANMSGQLNMETRELQHGFIKDSNCFAWVTGKLIFENAGVDEIRRTVRKVYGVDLRFDEELNCVSLNATFSNEPLANILNTLESLYALDYSRVSDKEYELVGMCNQNSK